MTYNNAIYIIRDVHTEHWLQLFILQRDLRFGSLIVPLTAIYSAVYCLLPDIFPLLLADFLTTKNRYLFIYSGLDTYQHR